MNEPGLGVKKLVHQAFASCRGGHLNPSFQYGPSPKHLDPSSFHFFAWNRRFKFRCD